MSELLHREFTFPEGCICTQMVIRQTNGIDEGQASLAAESDPRKTIMSELVRLSIVAVDHQRVMQPFIALDGWDSITRLLVMEAFQQLNTLPDEKRAIFIVASKLVDPETLAPLNSKDSSDTEEASTEDTSE